MDAIARCCGVVVDPAPRQMVNRGEGKTSHPFRMHATMLAILCALVMEPTLVLCWTPVGTFQHYCTRARVNLTRSNASTEGITIERRAGAPTFIHANILYASTCWYPPPQHATRYRCECSAGLSFADASPIRRMPFAEKSPAPTVAAALIALLLVIWSWPVGSQKQRTETRRKQKRSKMPPKPRNPRETNSSLLPNCPHTPHVDCLCPFTIGGTQQAGAPNPSERRTIDTLLKERGLRAEHGYAYTSGDCGFNSLSYLSGEDALAIRHMAMQLFGPHIMACTDTDELEAFNRSMIGHMRAGMTPEGYVRAMQVSATEGGLWADPIALDWAGKAMHVTIEVFRLVTTRTDVGEMVRLDSQTYGAMNFDPVRGEPKVLRLLFTGPVTAGHYTPVTKLVVRPTLQRPDLPPCMHWEPQQEQFCLLHAFNPLVGQKTATPDRLISWFQKQQITPTYPHHKGTFNRQGNDIFNPCTGNFNPNAFALWVLRPTD